MGDAERGLLVDQRQVVSGSVIMRSIEDADCFEEGPVGVAGDRVGPLLPGDLTDRGLLPRAGRQGRTPSVEHGVLVGRGGEREPVAAHAYHSGDGARGAVPDDTD